MASNAMNVRGGWQSEMNVCERNRHMLENELETDVTFQVSSPQDGNQVAKLRAHRYMLISASPVFWAMLCGKLREQGDIVVPDVAPDAFREMLRFIYTNEVTINGQNVMQILHAAKKYQLSILVKQCVNFLDNELKASNACSILDHCHFFGEKELAKKCLDKIERNTEEVLSSDDFMSISSETLGAILDSTRLAMDEVKLFKMAYQWASKRKDQTTSIRTALGSNVYKIRFPTMNIKDFTEIVCSKDVLTADEQLQILKYLASPETSSKPESFCCETRKAKPQSRSQVNEAKTRDRVSVIQGGRFPFYPAPRRRLEPEFVRSSEQGVIEGITPSGNFILRLDSGRTVEMHPCNVQKIA